jgi:hypothetical protein
MGGRNGQKKGGKCKKKKRGNKTGRPRLRFQYGDRVECCVGGGYYETGTVVRLWYDTELVRTEFFG